MASHLLKEHGIDSETPRQKATKKRQIGIEEAMLTAHQHPHKRRHMAAPINTNFQDECSPVDPDTLEVLFVNLIAACNLPLRFTECEAFRMLVQYLNNLGGDILPESHHTLKGWVQRQYLDGHAKTKVYLSKFQSKIHISNDGWKSDNSLSIIGFVGHGVDEFGELVEVVLGMRQMRGPHTGENMAPILHEIIEEYGM